MATARPREVSSHDSPPEPRIGRTACACSHGVRGRRSVTTTTASGVSSGTSTRRGQVTEYVYDAVGNILEVRRGAAVHPTITSVVPDAVRRGQSVPVQVLGSGLAGAALASPDAGLRISDVRAKDQEVDFVLTVAETVPLGPQSFTLSSSTGSSSFRITIKPVLPRIQVKPSLVVLEPGGAVQLAVTLSSSDLEAHHIDLTISNASVASVSSAALDIPAGQTQAEGTVTVTALALGNAVLDLSSATLAQARAGIWVTTEGPGERLRTTPPVGVVRDGTGTGAPSGPFAARPVGVVREGADVAGRFHHLRGTRRRRDTRSAGRGAARRAVRGAQRRNRQGALRWLGAPSIGFYSPGR